MTRKEREFSEYLISFLSAKGIIETEEEVNIVVECVKECMFVFDKERREYFAGMALQGMLANSNPHNLPFSKGQRITNIAVECSDALIKELDE